MVVVFTVLVDDGEDIDEQDGVYTESMHISESEEDVDFEEIEDLAWKTEEKLFNLFELIYENEDSLGEDANYFYDEYYLMEDEILEFENLYFSNEISESEFRKELIDLLEKAEALTEEVDELR